MGVAAGFHHFGVRVMKNLFAKTLALGLGVAVLAPFGTAAADDWDRDRYDRYDRGDRYDRDDRYDRHSRYDRDGRSRYDRDGWRDGRRAYAHRDRWDRWDRGVDRAYHYDRWDRNWRYDGRRWRAPVRYVQPRGYYSYRWRVGHRLPSGYYGRPYYVDYRSYNLAPPPYGHRWVRVDNDVFLVAIASGLISHAIHDLFYY